MAETAAGTGEPHTGGGVRARRDGVLFARFVAEWADLERKGFPPGPEHAIIVGAP